MTLSKTGCLYIYMYDLIQDRVSLYLVFTNQICVLYLFFRLCSFLNFILNSFSLFFFFFGGHLNGVLFSIMFSISLFTSWRLLLICWFCILFYLIILYLSDNPDKWSCHLQIDCIYPHSYVLNWFFFISLHCMIPLVQCLVVAQIWLASLLITLEICLIFSKNMSLAFRLSYIYYCEK